MRWSGGRLYPVKVYDQTEDFFTLSGPLEEPLAEFDQLWMRIDPPFNMSYIYLTYLLEQAQQQGLEVFNDPGSIRDANEKLFTLHFPTCTPETLVSSDYRVMEDFVQEHQRAVIKPLDGMGGASVFRLSADDPNRFVIYETLTKAQSLCVMLQPFIEDIVQGDKRIIMINGEPAPYGLARIPRADDFRGNLAAGASAKVVGLSARDRFIAEEVGPVLRGMGLVLVGLDVIGDYLTEINVTSPTCVREIEAEADLYLADQILSSVL